jgi:RND family efflux transporter MFP subunit
MIANRKTGMSSTLRDELASLRIERRPKSYGRSKGGGGNWGLGLLSTVLWLIPLAFLSGAGFLAYNQYERLRPKAEVTVAQVQAMTAGEASKVLAAKGYIRSRYQAAVGTKVPGRIEQLLVEEGTRVEKGQLLAVLEHNDIDAQIASRQASRARVQAEQLEARADLVYQERRADRLSRLYVQKNASVEEVEQAISDRDKAQARVAALEAAIQVIDAQIREAEETLRNMKIVAPFDGTVLTKVAEVGETINTMSLGTSGGRSALIDLADLDNLDVETDVAESMLSRVRPGQPALVSVSAVPGKTFHGQVRQIIPMGDRTRGTIKVKVAILDPDGQLFPELLATVSFLPSDESADETARADETRLYLPADAVVREGESTFAWVVDSKGVVTRRAIQVVESGGNVQVESGLKAGDSVVVNPSLELRDGQTVRVTD